jgi:hypothetical protein
MVSGRGFGRVYKCFVDGATRVGSVGDGTREGRPTDGGLCVP